MEAALSETSSFEPEPTPLRMVLAAYRLSLRRLALSKFMWANLILVAIPIVICSLIAIFDPSLADHKMAGVHERYEFFLHILFLRFIVFFLANIFGFAVVRQDIEDQTLHYLLLQPAPRWTLFLAKYLAYLTIVSVFCIGSLWIGYGILSVGIHDFSAVVEDLFAKGRFFVLIKESLVLMLGLMAYGAVAMLGGSFFKTALYAVLLWFWEMILPFLPVVLKKWTVLFYLQSLLPEKPQDFDKMFVLLGDPPSTLACLLVPFIVAAIALGAALYVFYERECQYSES